MKWNWASVEGPWSPRSGRKRVLHPVDEDRETESFKVEGHSTEKPVGKPAERAGGKPVKTPGGKPGSKPARKKRGATQSTGGTEMTLDSKLLPSVPVTLTPLSEYPRVRQIASEGFRRWFANGYFDLIVWYRDDRTTLVGFQLCFEGKALTWTAANGYDFSTIDDGEQGAAGTSKMTPVLVPGGSFKQQVIAQRFQEAAVNVDKELADFIVSRITAFRRSR
jgi:hypothetical protein